jgi:PAS domain S-box-containing protein
LTRAGYAITFERVETAAQMRRALEKQPWEMVISDFSMPELDGYGALQVLQETGLDIPFIVVSGTMGEETAVEMMKAGAHDYVMKGNLPRLAPAVERELSQAAVRRERKQVDESLRESEEKFRQTFDISPVGIVMVGLDKRFIRCNLAFSQFLGYGTEELVGKLIEDVTLPEDSHIGMAEMMAIMKGEIAKSQVQKRYIRKDGQVVWGEVTISLIRDSEGRAQYFLAIIQNITARKQAEEILKASEERFATMFHSNPAAVAISRLDDGRLADVNAAWLEVTGYACVEAVGHTPLELNLWGQPAQRERLVEAVRRQGRARGEIQLRRKSGELRDLLMSAELVELKGERYLLTMAQDITARKQAEEALHESEEKYRAVVDKANDGIVIGQDGLIKFSNSSFAAMLGYQVSEVAGIEFSGLIPPENLELLLERYQKRLAGVPVPSLYETALLHKSGARIPVEVNASTVSFEGKPADLVIMRDTTERKQAEEALQESETRLSTIFKNIPTGLFIVNEKTRIIYDVNDSALEAIGLPRGDVVGKVCHRFLCPAEMGSCPICDLGQVVDRSERVLIKPGGARVPILKTVVPIKLKGENYLLESFIDITERKQAEEELRQKGEELRARNDELEQFNRAAVGRELRMIELKQEINELCRRLGEPPRHATDQLQTDSVPGAGPAPKPPGGGGA